MFQPMIARDMLPGDHDCEFDPLMCLYSCVWATIHWEPGTMLGSFKYSSSDYWQDDQLSTMDDLSIYNFHELLSHMLGVGT